jgi:triacylglycerol lipase
MHISLKPIAVVVAHGGALIPNDALVRIDSAKWGDFRGCIPADHADEVGAFGDFSWSAFGYVDFFRLRAFELQRRGY